MQGLAGMASTPHALSDRSLAPAAVIVQSALQEGFVCWNVLCLVRMGSVR